MWDMSISTFMASAGSKIFVTFKCFFFFHRKEERARNILKTTIEDINCVFVAFCNNLLHNRSKNWHYVQAYKNWLFAWGFAQGAPNDTLFGLLDTLMHYLKVYRGGF